MVNCENEDHPADPAAFDEQQPAGILSGAKNGDPDLPRPLQLRPGGGDIEPYRLAPTRC